VFNPYLVPGFPIAIFDQRATRVDVLAYATLITHKLTHSREGRTTQVSYVYGRTFQELLDLLSAQFAAGGAATGAAPAEPIREIRQVIQDFEQAEQFYQALFFGRQPLFGNYAACDWRKRVGYESIGPGQPPEKVIIEGPTEAGLGALADAGGTIVALTPQLESLKLDFARTKAAKESAEHTIQQISSQVTNSLALGDLAAVTPQVTNPSLSSVLSAADQVALDQANATLNDTTIRLKQLRTQIATLEEQLAAAQAVVNQHQQQLKTTQVIHNLDATRELVPLPAAEKLFANYDDAIRYNWRPICTLDEYLIFHQSVGEGTIPAFNHPRSVGARYYERIRRLKPLTADFQFPAGSDGLSPQPVPSPNAANQSAPNAIGETITPASTTTVVPGLGSDFPATRAAWDELLLEYRRNVYNVQPPRT